MITENQLIRIAPSIPRNQVRSVVSALNVAMKAGAINTPARVAVFLGQIIHECGDFKYSYEFWGPTPVQKRYEGRKDLGNVQRGDGYRYRGRGWIQITGRNNYRLFGRMIGVDLESNPDLAATPEIAAKVAVAYWSSRRRVWTSRGTESVTGNELADRGDILGASRFINGSVAHPWGLEQRIRGTKNALAVLREGFVADSPVVETPVSAAPKLVPAQPAVSSNKALVILNGADISGQTRKLVIKPEHVGATLTVNATNPNKVYVSTTKD